MPAVLNKILSTVGIILQFVFKDSLPRLEFCNIITLYDSMRIVLPVIVIVS